MQWPVDKIFVNKKSAAGKIFCEKTALQAKLMKKMTDFLTES